MDLYTGLIKLIFVHAANAIVVCESLLGRWIPDQGFPLQLLSDIGTSNFNDVVLLLYKITGIQGFYATPRRHKSTGMVERAIREVNQHFRVKILI